MKPRSNKIYEFGPYRLDFAVCKLWRGTEEVKLRPKLFDLLCLFLDHSGQMLGREEVIQYLWPDSVVEDSNLTVTVNALRAALHDGTYIETVSRRGYRFAGHVTVVSNDRPEFEVVAGSSELAEPPGGAVPLQSRFYIPRAADQDFCRAIARSDSIVLVKGARQVGKTSLLARGLEEARTRGSAVMIVDFQRLSSSAFKDADSLLLATAELIAEQMDLGPVSPTWKSFLGASSNFERFLKREVLAKTDAPVVWGLDEVDRLFAFQYARDIFGLFRSWHNLRALDPDGPWRRLTLAIAYATEAHLFISDLNQSPFNVGTRLSLGDFTLAQLVDLNLRYGEPLASAEQASRFHDLLGGHPYLTQRGLYELARSGSSLESVIERADLDEGPFGDHLQRMLVSLEQDPNTLEELRGFLGSGTSFSAHIASRLRSAGILSDDVSSGPKFRCELYTRYLTTHLL
jgi:DNA-binding winged helix-turn-helix (wHTH) protein